MGLSGLPYRLISWPVAPTRQRRLAAHAISFKITDRGARHHFHTVEGMDALDK